MIDEKEPPGWKWRGWVMDWVEVWKALRDAGMVRPTDADCYYGGSVIIARAGAIILRGRRVFAELVFEEPIDPEGGRPGIWKISEMIPAAPGKTENNS